MKDFNPIFRMIVCSDIHFGESTLHPENYAYRGQEYDRFEQAIRYAYAYADGCEYQTVDAFCAVGDFITTGQEFEMVDFKASLDRVIRKETDITLTMASHEYFHDGVENANERLARIFGQEPMRHTKIKGFHIIGLSTDDRCQTGVEKQEWLRRELAAAHADDPKKPIFFMFHPQFQNTVYGSAVLWRTANITRITMNHPQVISFSGHSHAPLHDPRTVHQKHFTAFGTGAIIGLSLCNADRMPIVQTPTLGQSQLQIVEADADGRVRVLPMDGTNGKFLREGWVVEKPYDPDSFIYTDARYDAAQKPTFPEDAKLTASYADGKLTVSVTQASDGDERVPGYHFAVKGSDGMIWRQFGICSGYYLCDMPPVAEYTVDLEAPAGEYTVVCRAYSFFDKISDPIVTKITV